MKMCNIGIKDVVEVCEDNERSLFIAWPSRSIVLTGVSTCKHRKTSGTKKVAVSKYSDCIVAASSVTVVPDQCLLQASLPELQKCLVHQTMGLFVQSGSKLQCRFYGRDLQFTVTGARGEDEGILFPSLSGDTLADSMQHLEINTDPIHQTTPRGRLSRAPRKPSFKSTPQEVFSTPVAFSTPKAPELCRASENERVPFHQIKATTNITIAEKEAPSIQKTPGSVGYVHIGGLDKEIRQMRELVELPMKNPGVFSSFGESPRPR